jgi:hypothetical protein
MIPLKDFFDIDGLQYLKENLDKITKEDIENAIKEEMDEEILGLVKFENKIVLVQPNVNFVKIYKFGSIDRENCICYYDYMEFIYNNKSISCNVANNILIRNLKEFNFNPKDYTLLTEDEYNDYLNMFETIKLEVRCAVLKNTIKHGK